MAMHYTSELIESILKSPRSREILGWMPMVYDEAYVFLWLLETIGRELDDMESWSEEFQEQVVPQTATWTIPYWEEKYGIASNSEMPIEKRRERIVLKMQERIPMNPYRLEEILSKVTGAAVEIQENTGKNRFTVCFQGGLEAFAVAVKEINRLKPAYTIYTVRYLHDLCIVVKNSYRAGIVFTLGVVARDKTYAGFKKIRFDGAWRWDGSVRLNETPYGWDANGLYEIGCVFGASVPQKVTVESAQEHKAEIPVSVSVKSGGADLTAGMREVCEIERPAVTASAGTVCETGYGAEIEVRKNLWRLDGTVRLDGSRRLNAEEYTVKL